jgi:pimeloyl-[acyl-carrier protein] methyl ester esterase
MKTLVFLHGWGATGNIWRGQREAFLGPGLTVLTPTLPVWEASWLAGYLQELPLAETVLVGWSLGGMLLLEALAAELLKPAGLVLVATPASFCQGPDHPWGQPRSVVRALRRAVATDSRRGLTDFAGRCLASGEGNFQEQLMADFQPRTNGANLTAGLDYLLNTDLRPQLSRVPAGALIIQGEEDGIVPPAQTDFLGQHLQNAQVMKFSGAGHVLFFTRAAEFNEVLKDFLREGVREHGSPELRKFTSQPVVRA